MTSHLRRALGAIGVVLALAGLSPVSFAQTASEVSWQSSLAAANSLAAGGDHAGAEKQFSLAWGAVAKNGQPTDQLLVLLSKGGNEIDLNDYSSAVETFRLGTTVARQNNLTSPLADMQAYLAESYRLQKSYDLALSSVREARSSYVAVKDAGGQAFSFVIEGRVDQDQQKYDLALAAFNQSLSLVPFNFGAVRGAAECDQVLGKYADSEQLLLAALPHETGSNSVFTSQLLGDDYFKWAQALSQRQDDAGVIRYAHQAVQTYSKAMPLRAAEALTWTGTYLSNRGQIQQALIFDKSALALSRAVHNSLLQFYALSSLANDYQSAGQSALALKTASEEIRTAQASKDKALLWKAYASAALIASANGYDSLASGYTKREWQTAQQSGDREAMANAANAEGMQYFMTWDGGSSLAWYGKAATNYTADENDLSRRQTFLGLGRTYGALGDLAMAHQNFNSVEKLSEQNGDYDEERNALLLDATFQAHFHRIDLVESDIAQLLDLLKSHPEIDDATGQLGVQIGNLFLSVDQVGPARVILTKALAKARQSGAKDVEAQADLGLGTLEDRNREYQQAAMSYQAALAIYTSAGNNRQVAQGLLSMAFDELHAGDAAKAKADLYLSLKLRSTFADPADMAITLSTLGYLYSSQGSPSAAVAVEKTGVNLLQNMRRGIRFVNAAYDTNFLRDYRSFYVQLAETLIQQGRLAEAQQVIGLIKVHEFDQFTSRGSATSLPGSTLSFTPGEVAWRSRYQKIAGQITAFGRDKDQLLERQAMAKIGQGLFTTQDEKRLSAVNADLALSNHAFELFLESVPKEFPSAEIGQQKSQEIAQAAGLHGTLRSLGHGSVLVYTLVEDDKYRAIVVTGQTETTEQYPIDSRKLSAKIFAFRDLIQDPDSDPRPAANELYKIIVGPIEKDLEGAGAKTIMWSLDGVLRYLPVSALYDGQHYLMEKYRSDLVTLADSARLETQPKANWTVVGMGVSKAQPGFEALPSVPDELREVVRSSSDPSGILPGEVMLDSQFTQDSMMQALKEQKYAVIHIASHYSFHPGTDLDSFLLLGDGTHLSLATIGTLPQLFQGVDLVTLSACNTAMGSAGADGREIDGLALTAQREGAQAVLATLWPIADESTQLFMKDFYSYYESHPGASKADALQSAQLALLHGATHATATPPIRRGDAGDAAADAPDFPYDPKAPFAHPYFWAPFILIGNWK